MPEALLVVSLGAILIAGALTIAQTLYSRVFAQSALDDFRLVLRAVSELSSGRPDYTFLGTAVSDAVSNDAIGAGADLVLSARILPPRMGSYATGGPLAGVLSIGRGRTPLSIAHGRACAGCRNLGLSSPSVFTISTGTGDFPVLNASLCRTLLSFEHPALVYVALRSVLGSAFPGPHAVYVGPVVPGDPGLISFASVDRSASPFTGTVKRLRADERTVSVVAEHCDALLDGPNHAATFIHAFAGVL